VAEKTCSGPCGRKLPLNEEHFAKNGVRNGKQRFCSSCRRCNMVGDPTVKTEHLEGAKPWATAYEREVIEAVLAAAGDVATASFKLGIAPQLLRGRLQEIERRAARQGYSPGADMTKPVPEGFHVKGVSTYYDADGNVRGQWVKSNKDQESRAEVLLAALSRLAEPFQGVAEPVAPTAYVDEDLLCVIPFGDPHFGMQAWRAETGEDFDLKIAESDLVTAVDHLVALAPPAKQGLVVSLGDLFHSDSKKGETTRGTRVDVDSRQSKVIGVVIRAMRRCIDRALERFEHVTFVPVCGNHDDYSSLMLGHAIAGFYEREPRVTVDTSPAKFHKFRFGANLIGMTHGDTAKLEQLGEIMACDWPADWAETTSRIWLTGHVHHSTVKELRGCTVETFRTLASSDAWHHASGYRSGRDLRLDILHREFGWVNRHIVGINQIHAKQRAKAATGL
jgi:predicted phosphodiesterase